MRKSELNGFALFGGAPVFQEIRSISNLVRPDFNQFLKYSDLFLGQADAADLSEIESHFERRMADFHEVAECISFCGGFWGLVLTMQALALPGRKKVIMPSLTYRRLADIVAWAGLTPHFCEVDPVRLCITAETAAECITEDTALILGVHPIVNCCDALGLEALSERTGIPLMFDAVESVYETAAGRKVGGFGRAECFSMQSSKLFNAFEGGYVTTNDRALAQRLRLKRNLGVDGEGRWHEPGMNARQIGPHLAMALAALDGVEQQVLENRQRYRRYVSDLQKVPQVRLLPFDESEKNGYKNIVVELLPDWPVSRDLTLKLLHAENMLCRAYYSPALHQKETGYAMVWGDLSRTEALAARYLMLPCGYFVSEDDVGQVVDFLADIVEFADQLKDTPRSLA